MAQQLRTRESLSRTDPQDSSQLYVTSAAPGVPTNLNSKNRAPNGGSGVEWEDGGSETAGTGRSDIG